MVRRRRRRSRNSDGASIEVALLSPLATRLIESGRVDLATIVGTGDGGCVTDEDVLSAAGPLDDGADDGSLEASEEGDRPRPHEPSETGGSVDTVFQVETTSPSVLLMSPWPGHPLTRPDAALGDPYGPPTPYPAEQDAEDTHDAEDLMESPGEPDEHQEQDEAEGLGEQDEGGAVEAVVSHDQPHETPNESQNGETPVSTQEKLQETIASLHEAIPDLTGVMVASKDGFPIAHDFAPEESDRLAAMAATALGLGRRITETAGLGGFEQAVVWGTEGCLLVFAAGQGVLALGAPSGANLGLVRIEARNAVGVVAGLL